MLSPRISVMTSDGSEVWYGSLLAFARDNGHDVARDVIGQFRNAREVHGNYEPAFIGGGAAQEFMVCLVDARDDVTAAAKLETVRARRDAVKAELRRRHLSFDRWEC